MEKTLKELIAEMDRIEEAGLVSQEQYIQMLAEKFYDALKEISPLMPEANARAAAAKGAEAAANANNLTSVPTPQSIENPRSAN